MFQRQTDYIYFGNISTTAFKGFGPKSTRVHKRGEDSVIDSIKIIFTFRYYALVHPLSSLKIHSKSRTRVIISVTWVLAAILAGPYTFCKSYPFSTVSELGSVTRQICTDRFDDIDFAIYGPDLNKVGSFRKGFFLFLFFTVYLIPLIIIVMTSVKIAKCLLRPITENEGGAQYQTRIGRKREENKRKVSDSK